MMKALTLDEMKAVSGGDDWNIPVWREFELAFDTLYSIFNGYTLKQIQSLFCHNDEEKLYVKVCYQVYHG